MTSNDITLIETFQSFCENACTRGGSRFVVDRFALCSPNEGGHKAIGKVYLKRGKNGNEIPLEMEWALSGNALKIGTQFDLIVEEAF